MNCAVGYVWSYPSGLCIPYSQYTHGFGTINCIPGTYWNGAGCIQYPSLTNQNIGGFSGGLSGNGNMYGSFGSSNMGLSSSTIIIVLNNLLNKHCVGDWIWNGYSCVNL